MFRFSIVPPVVILITDAGLASASLLVWGLGFHNKMTNILEDGIFLRLCFKENVSIPIEISLNLFLAVHWSIPQYWFQ